MKRRDSRLEPELEAFLKHRTIERRVPPETRARALARARAILPRGEVASPQSFLSIEAPMPTPPGAPEHRRFWIALAVSLLVACAAVAAVAALRARSAHAPQVIAQEIPPPVPDNTMTRIGSPPHEPSAPDVKRAMTADPPRPARTAPKENVFTAELELLQRAHAAYMRREFSFALTLIAEHTRRFPRGRLAEQREALRVRSLLGAGRADDAHRAAAAFSVRFPRSVLLSRLAGPPESSAP